MSGEVFKVPRGKRSQKSPDGLTPAKRRKIKERFLRFCDIVLSYTQYEQQCHEEMRSRNTSPDSGGSSVESCSSEPLGLSYEGSSPAQFSSHHLASMPSTNSALTREDDSESVTCFCGKPFSHRPMIECSQCLTWIHLSCAKIRKTNIPEDFICQQCRDSSSQKRKSGRMRFEKKLQDV